MSHPWLFLVPLIIFTVFLLTAAYTFLVSASDYGKRHSLELIPRAKLPGIVLGAIVTAACIPHALQLLSIDPANTSMTIFVWIAAAVLFLLAAVYVDFPFARALAGAGIFLTYLLLREGYAVHPPYYSVLAVFFFLFGTFWIVIAAKPVWMRNMLRLAVDKKYFRICMGLVCLVIGIISAAIGVKIVL